MLIGVEVMTNKVRFLSKMAASFSHTLHMGLADTTRT